MNSIPASDIVNVTPNVLAAGGSALDMVGLALTTNTQVPIGDVHSFANALDVSDYFGGGSTEAAAAAIYFQGFDNSNVKPGAMLFAQYNQHRVHSYLRGGDISGMSLTTLQGLSGALDITVSTVPYNASGIDLSGATSFSDAASILQTALQAEAPASASFTASIATPFPPLPQPWSIMTVTAVGSGTLYVGMIIAGTGVTDGTLIVGLDSGTGGTGTYFVSPIQTVASESMTGGVASGPTVTYDSVSGAFVITSPDKGNGSTIAYATGTLAAPLLLTQATGAVLSQGVAAQVPATFMNNLIEETQDWATFMTLFDPDADGDTGNAVKLAFAQWVSTTDDRYAYVCWDTDASPQTTVPATTSLGYLLQQGDYSGTFLINCPDYTKAAFAIGIGASIDFTETNGRITYKFRSQTGLVPDITNQSVASNLIANGYNFYGAWATANQQFQGLSPGSVSGPFEWMDSYINQIWLNNEFQLALMELLFTVKSIPYNSTGYALIEAACADVINAGLNFGAFRAGVTLSAAQAAEVNNAAGTTISNVLSSQGWYLQVKDASPQVRQARQSPPCTFWYMDGEAVQQIDLTSIDVQ